MLLALVMLAIGCSADGPETPADPAGTLGSLILPAADDELDRALHSAEMQASQLLPPQFQDQVYRSVLDRLVSFHLFLQASEALNISAGDTPVDARLEVIRSSFLSNEAFESQLNGGETTFDTMRVEREAGRTVPFTEAVSQMCELLIEQKHQERTATFI